MNRLTLLFAVMAAPALILTNGFAQQRITIQINKQTDNGNSTYDTTFTAPASFDLNAWLEETKLQQTQPGETVSTTIIISDEDDQEAAADVIRPEIEHREPGMMGVYLEDDAKTDRGVPVKSVIKGSAAERAGMLAQDTIIRMNGQEVRNFDDLVRAKDGFYAGDKLPLTIRRGSETLDKTLELTGRKPVKEEEEHVNTHSPRAFLGVYPEDLTAGRAEELGLEDLQGIYLAGVVSGSSAEAAGLKKQDVIIRMNGRDVQAAWELGEVLRDLTPGDELEISYIRDGAERQTSTILTSRQSPRPQIEHQPRRMLIEETRAFLGVTLQTDSDAPGVPVIGVERHSAADEAGLRSGDLIMKIDGSRTVNYDSLASIMRRLEPNETVKVVYLRDERRRRTKATLGNRTTTTWVRVDGDEHMNPDEIIRKAGSADRQSGEQLRKWMDRPTLNMDFFELYPNPSDGIFTIHWESETPAIINVRVFDPEGKTVFQDQLQRGTGSTKVQVDLGPSAVEGLYLIMVRQGNEGMVRKMIVRR